LMDRHIPSDSAVRKGRCADSGERNGGRAAVLGSDEAPGGTVPVKALLAPGGK
jgi:hypothetical protein